MIPVLNPDDSSEENKDVLSGLSPDEKECLEYLLQTIDTLDKDLLEDGDEVSQEQRTDSLGEIEDRWFICICRHLLRHQTNVVRAWHPVFKWFPQPSSFQ